MTADILPFLAGSLADFSTLLPPFFCCAAATHRFSLLFLIIFPTGYRFFRRLSATSRGFCRNFSPVLRLFCLVSRRFSASSVVAAVFSCAAAATNRRFCPQSHLTALGVGGCLCAIRMLDSVYTIIIRGQHSARTSALP